MSEWISVLDKLPVNGQAVLCYQSIPPHITLRADAGPLKRCWHEVLEYCHFGKDYHFINRMNEDVKWITHWMPLPQPPESV